MTRVIGIISIKGGVGKTSAVSALGASLANSYKKKVLVIDGNFASPNLGLHLGINDSTRTIHNVLQNKIKIKDAIIESGYGFDIIPGFASLLNIEPSKLREKIADIKHKYDVVLIDASPDLNKDILPTMIASDELLIVTTPDKITLDSTLHAVKVAKDKRTPILGLILNKVHKKDFEVGIEAIEDSSGVKVVAVLPYELNVLEALSQSIPSSLHKKSKSTKEYNELAGMIVGEFPKRHPLKSIVLRFMKKLPKQEVNRVVLTQKRVRLF
jgi:MinD-like ATPase involved in chromosome partitioning or flagellar assembly